MKLFDLEQFNPITVQCHDNPDADSIGSGFGIFRYFQSRGKNVRLIYGGRNRIHKANLLLMVDKLEIPIEYVENRTEKLDGLLITVDCQYGAGNVSAFRADHVAVIDHHQIEIPDLEYQEIHSNLGSCSTLVWSMLGEAGYPLNEDRLLSTALYYGLYSDTNQFAELFNPLDMDMRENLDCDMSLIRRFRNANLSLQELELAGVALIRHIYNNDYQYAIIKAPPCDPNILGMISDFLIQVDEVKSCIVYNEINEGIKLSARSCTKEVDASELASFVCGDIGSGGGHLEKAGGFISMGLYERDYPTLHTEAYFSQKMNEYFDNTQIIYAKDYEPDPARMKKYSKKPVVLGYVRSAELYPEGTSVTLRTKSGDRDIRTSKELYIMIRPDGEAYSRRKESFEGRYQEVHVAYDGRYGVDKYAPMLKNKEDGTTRVLAEYAKACMPKKDVYVYAMELTGTVKVFTLEDEEHYSVGRAGDFLVVQCDDLHDLHVVSKNVFDRIYTEIVE